MYPTARYVDVENEREEQEELTAGQKQKKNPTGEDWHAYQKRLGRNHQSFDNASWADSLHLGQGALENASSNVFDRGAPESSAGAEWSGQQMEEDRAKIAAEKKEIADAKKLAKPFPAKSLLGIAKPQVVEKYDKVEKKMKETRTKATKQLAEIKADTVIHELITEATEIICL